MHHNDPKNGNQKNGNPKKGNPKVDVPEVEVPKGDNPKDDNPKDDNPRVDFPQDDNANGGDVTPTHFSAEPSPTSKKRSVQDFAETSPGKKAKVESDDLDPVPLSPSPSPSLSSTPSSPGISAIDQLKENWQGYCEIESDPAYFSVILREIGIQGVNVEELVFLDPGHLMTLPPIHGLVLLFRHRAFDEDYQETVCPKNVWFANQMPGQNSCATLAMIHTLLNVQDPDVDIGEHMREFKKFTQDMKPSQRGHTFASWNYVKKIHNSFAKKMDMFENDKYIAKKSAQEGNSKDVAPKKAEAPKKVEAPKTTSRSRSQAERRNSEDSNASVEEFEANAHHYIAFVPIDGDVWKLDGMDKQPTLMGEYDEDQGEMWFDSVSDRINSLIAAGDNDYGIFAITQSPLIPIRNQLLEADNTIKYVDARLTTLDTDWKEFLDEDETEPPSPSFMGSFSEADRAMHPVPGSIKAAADKEDLDSLLERHCDLVSRMRGLVMEYMEKEQEVEDQNQRAADRRWDYGPAIQKWLSMLAENGYLEENLMRFYQG